MEGNKEIKTCKEYKYLGIILKEIISKKRLCDSSESIQAMRQKHLRIETC
jgi:hypothetical protein